MEISKPVIAPESVMFFKPGTKHEVAVGNQKVEIPVEMLEKMTTKEFEEFITGHLQFDKMTSNATLARLFTDSEIEKMRQEIATKTIEDIPALESEYRDARIAAKAMIDEAKSSLQSMQTQIKDLAGEIKQGKTDYKVEGAETFTLIFGNTKFLFVEVGEGYKLVSKQNISESEMEKWYNKQNLNNEHLLNGLFAEESLKAVAVAK